MKKIQIPSKISINAIPIQIKLGKKWDRRCNEEHRYGAFFGNIKDGRIIYIHSKQNSINLSATFIHELIEAIKGINDLQLSHTNVCIISNSLHQILEELGIIFVNENEDKDDNNNENITNH